MHKINQKVRSILVLGLATFGLAGCFGDPAGPGVTGKVQLGQGTLTDNMTTMYIKAVPDDAQKPFNLTAPGFPDSLKSDVTGWGHLIVDFAGVKFPYVYETSDALGTTPHEHWRIYAWLSKSADEVAPTSGEPFGTNTFNIKSCEGYGDFCTTTSDVNIVLDKTAP